MVESFFPLMGVLPNAGINRTINYIHGACTSVEVGIVIIGR
mgnify:CR=1 FL=1